MKVRRANLTGDRACPAQIEGQVDSALANGDADKIQIFLDGKLACVVSSKPPEDAVPCDGGYVRRKK